MERAAQQHSAPSEPLAALTLPFPSPDAPPGTSTATATHEVQYTDIASVGVQVLISSVSCEGVKDCSRDDKDWAVSTGPELGSMLNAMYLRAQSTSQRQQGRYHLALDLNRQASKLVCAWNGFFEILHETAIYQRNKTPEFLEKQ